MGKVPETHVVPNGTTVLQKINFIYFFGAPLLERKFQILKAEKEKISKSMPPGSATAYYGDKSMKRIDVLGLTQNFKR